MLLKTFLLISRSYIRSYLKVIKVYTLRGSRRGKMGLGFGCFFDWEMGFVVLGMGFLSLGMGKRTLNGNGI